MSLAQQLLLRALIAWFWREPQRRRAGALGHRAARPLHARSISSGRISSSVLGRSARAPAIAFDPVWFEAQREFRFPFYGAVTYGGVRARAAPGAGALARAGRGGHGRRHRALRRFLGRAAAGEGRRAQRRPPCRHLQRAPRCRWPRPAAPANIVAGVRFKAWKLAVGAAARPSTCMRRSPSTSIDSWSRRSLGGCVYHVAHPGGRNYETFPVNSYEAEARRRGALPGSRPHARAVRQSRRKSARSNIR